MTDTTRPYEALVIFRPAGTEQELAAAAAGFEGLIKKLSGTVQSAQAFGRRRLAYRIARQTEGHYYLFRFAIPPSAIGELERQLRLAETIVRFIVLATEEAVAAR